MITKYCEDLVVPDSRSIARISLYLILLTLHQMRGEPHEERGGEKERRP
jgi:hypothetical protein